MANKEIIKNIINHYIDRIIKLRKQQAIGLHDYSKSINIYKNKINVLVEKI